MAFFRLNGICSLFVLHMLRGWTPCRLSSARTQNEGWLHTRRAGDGDERTFSCVGSVAYRCSPEKECLLLFFQFSSSHECKRERLLFLHSAVGGWTDLAHPSIIQRWTDMKVYSRNAQTV